jgi:DNA-binding transcriptional MerR regulator
MTTLTIGQVSALTGLTTHTLRFYEQERLFFAPVRRDAAGRRVFTGEEVEWLKVCAKLRSSGMPLPEIRRYAELVVAGPGNEIERFEILRRHEAKVQQQVDDLQQALGIIHAKVEIYARHLSAGTADQLWRDEPECDLAPPLAGMTGQRFVVADERQRREPGFLVDAPCRRMTGIPACPDLSERDAELADLVDCQGYQRQADAPALAFRVDRHHLDLTRPQAILIVEDDRDETDRPTILDRHPDAVTLSPADRLNCKRLTGGPVRIHAPEDL